MGERKNWRLIFPGNDLVRFGRRKQMDVLETGGIRGSFPTPRIPATPSEGRVRVITQRLL